MAGLNNTRPVGNRLRGLISRDLEMIIIAFSNKTSKILPRVFCGELKHVAPITRCCNKMILHQFVRPWKIVQIPIRARDLGLLAAYGWTFIRIPHIVPNSIEKKHIYTCVQLAKHMIGVRDIRIQTPSALYRKLRFS